MVQQVLVTGAAGFIGSHLCEELLDQGCRVIGVDSFTDYYGRERKEANLAAALGRPAFRLVEADLLTAELPALLREVDGIYHLAGQPGVRGSWGQQFDTYTRNNILITQRLLEAALAAGRLPFVYASSSSVYGNQAIMPLREEMSPAPISPYGVTKLAAEHLCRLYHDVHRLPVACLRLFTVYGPRQRPDMAFTRFLHALAEGREIGVFGSGDQTRDFTYVQDVAQAFRLAMDFCRRGSEGTAGTDRVFNIAGGTRTSLRQALADLAEITGREPAIRYLPAQPGDVCDTWADTSRAREVLNWQPAVSLPAGLAAQWRSLF